MKCIYCETNNTYRDRRDGKCKKCGKPFAFEPKEMGQPLAMTDKRFQSAIAAVSGGGRLFFTSHQLYYQLIRRDGRASISFHTFEETLLHRWVRVHGRPDKLLDVGGLSRSTGSRNAEPDIQQYSFDRLLVVDRADTVQMLLANNLHFEMSMPIVSADGYPRDVFATVMTMVRRNPRLRVFVLHDADTNGCRLPLLLREEAGWFPSPNVAILDLGLRPMQIAAAPAFIEQKDPSSNPEGDPGGAPLPPELMRILSPGERRWLAAGNRGELAFFPPDRIMKTIYRMVQSAEGQELAARQWATFDLRGFCQTALPAARFAGFASDAAHPLADTAQQPAGAPDTGSLSVPLPGGATDPGVVRVSYSDHVVESDGSIERRYANGVTERRVVSGPGQIAWTDDQGGSGTDYNLGNGQVLRRSAAGGTTLGQQVGFGVTSWNDGARVTVNETPLPERAPETPPPSFIGRCVTGLGLGRVFGVGAIRLGKRRILPGSEEFQLYAEQQMMRRWMEARRISGPPYVPSGPYFWVDSPSYAGDTAGGAGGETGGVADTASGVTWGGGAWDTGAGTQGVPGGDQSGASSPSPGGWGDGGADGVSWGGDGGWDGGGGDSFG